MDSLLALGRNPRLLEQPTWRPNPPKLSLRSQRETIDDGRFVDGRLPGAEGDAGAVQATRGEGVADGRVAEQACLATR